MAMKVINLEFVGTADTKIRTRLFSNGSVRISETVRSDGGWEHDLGEITTNIEDLENIIYTFKEMRVAK